MFRPFAAALFVLTVLVACGDSAPTPRVMGVSISNGDQVLSVGQSLTLSVQVSVTGAASPAVTWTTSDQGVASVSDTGRVKAHGAGAATITARSVFDLTKSDATTVTVVDDPGATGIITGTITVGGGTTAAASGLRSAHDRVELPQVAWDDAEFVVGEIIVGLAPGVSAQTAGAITASGAALSVVESLPTLGAHLLASRALNATETLQVVAELRRRPDVRYAYPNYVVQIAAVPNDPLYWRQWHYPAIDLPAAWDITTGSPSVVVAVVDTGILHSFSEPWRTHPDLVGKVLPGYDFISDHRMAGDGDGRDDDPYDVGDNPDGQSSYHGSHVAGTIAAATNDGVGVAGVDWNAAIVPVRVLGIGGGTVFDVIQGTLWGAGHPIADVPNNPNPAHVINISLGWSGSCTTFEQDAFDWIESSSPNVAIVVAAAGNDDTDASLMAPANCRNVITVGATDYVGDRAPYSNHGSRIDVMAPGGDMSVDLSGDGFVDGVLSLTRFDATGALGYALMAGTSMAAPHVAGVASLMKSLDAGITRAEVLAALEATARPLSALACNRPSGTECGAGLIDAAAALALVRDDAIPSPGVGSLVFDPGVLDFGTSTVSRDVTLGNTGSTTLEWQATHFVQSSLNPGDMLDYSVLMSSLSGTIPANGSDVVSISLDRDMVTADGRYEFAVVFEVVGESSPANLYATFDKVTTTAPTLNGPMVVAAYVEDAAGELILSGFQVADTSFSEFAFTALAGSNEVMAWSDENGNGQIDAGDYLGVYPGLVDVIEGGVASGVDISVDEIIRFGMSQLAAPPTADHAPWRGALEELVRTRSQ